MSILFGCVTVIVGLMGAFGLLAHYLRPSPIRTIAEYAAIALTPLVIPVEVIWHFALGNWIHSGLVVLAAALGGASFSLYKKWKE